jgi:hypothetical protein
VGNGERALCQRFDLEHAHRPIPDNCLGSSNSFSEQFARLWSNIQRLGVVRDRTDAEHLGLRAGACLEVDTFTGKDIDGEDNFGAVLLQNSLAEAEFVRLEEGKADFVALSTNEGEGHATTNDQFIDFLDEVRDHIQLLSDLSSTKDSNERTIRVRGGTI